MKQKLKFSHWSYLWPTVRGQGKSPIASVIHQGSQRCFGKLVVTAAAVIDCCHLVHSLSGSCCLYCRTPPLDQCFSYCLQHITGTWRSLMIATSTLLLRVLISHLLLRKASYLQKYAWIWGMVIRALCVRIGLNSPDQPHLGPPYTPLVDGPRGSISAWAIRSCLNSHSYASSSSTTVLLPSHKVHSSGSSSVGQFPSSTSSLWNCTVISGLCLVTITDPDMPINFLAWLWIHVITTNFPGDLDFCLNVATVPSPV